MLALAGVQYGVLTSAQLRDVGLARATINLYAKIGWLHPLHRGVYATTRESLLTTRGRRIAAVLACGPGAVLSHRAAAAEHELITWRGGSIDVTVPTRAGRARPRIRVHRSGTLRPCDVTSVDCIPVTTVARTLLDLAEVLPATALERAFDRALALERLDLDALREQLTHGHARMGAHSLLGRILTAYAGPDQPPTWNDFEELVRRLVRDSGLPEPELQAYLDLGDGGPPIQPDFLWRAERVIVEADGWRFHGGRRRFEEDRRRDQRAMAAGYRTLRLTWSQATEEGARIAATLRAVVTRRV